MENPSRSRSNFPAPYVAPSAVHRRPSDLSTLNFAHNGRQRLTVNRALGDLVVFVKDFTLPPDSRIELKSADSQGVTLPIGLLSRNMQAVFSWVIMLPRKSRSRGRYPQFA